MALIHFETDSMRIDRLTQIFEAMEKKTQKSKIVKEDKISDYSECGVLFESRGQLINHIDKHHSTQSQELSSENVKKKQGF